jgi:hypothetical protein
VAGKLETRLKTSQNESNPAGGELKKAVFEENRGVIDGQDLSDVVG